MRQTIRFRCPGCGSDLLTPEGSVSHRCTYCGLASLLGSPGRIVKQYYPFRLERTEAKFIAERHLKESGARLFVSTPEIHQLYVPYYRFRGLSVSCLSVKKQELPPEAELPVLTGRKFELRARNVDVSMLGCSRDVVGLADLGIRPQAVSMHAYRDADVPQGTSVIPADRAPSDAYAAARKMDAANMERANGDTPADFSEMLGERLTLAYFPIFAIAGSTGSAGITVFVDALARRVYGQTGSLWSMPSLGKSALEIVDLQPRPHRCPNCGHDFAASERSIYYSCSNCTRAYMVEASGYRPMRAPIVSTGEGSLYPFWRIPMEFEGRVAQRTVCDFSRLLTAEVPLLDKRKASAPFFVYVPAFDGADAECQVHTGLRFTRTQPLVEPSEQVLEPFAPVTLAETESREFAAFVWNWLRMSYLHLRGAEHDYRAAKAGAAELVWLHVQDARLERSVMRALQNAEGREPIQAAVATNRPNF